MRRLLFYLCLFSGFGLMAAVAITAQKDSNEGLQRSLTAEAGELQALTVSDPIGLEGLPRDPNPLDQGNDNCPATVISSIPYFDTGTTEGMANNFTTAASCSETGTATGPDVIYSYTPGSGGWKIISTCGNSMNTLLEVRRDGSCPGTTQYACSDYGCNGQAEVRAYLAAGVTYYIIIDEPIASWYGPYQLSVREMCSVTFHSGDFQECWETADSSHARLDCNGGNCNEHNGGVASYEYISCGQTYYGRCFTYTRNDTNFRDTDWYRFTVPEPSYARVYIEAEFPVQLGIGPFTGQCTGLPYGLTTTTCRRDSVAVPIYDPAIEYVIMVAPFDMGGLSNPREYRLTLDCAPGNGCVIDTTLNAPDTLTRSTVGAGDHCGARPSLDENIRVNVPTHGVWTFSLCMTSNTWNPYIYLWETCCNGNFTPADSGCSNGMPVIQDLSLDAGTYYLLVEGNTTNDAGSYTLAVTGCRTDGDLTAPGNVMGNTCGAGADCPVFETGEDRMVRVTIPDEDDWTFSLSTLDGLSETLMANCCGLVIATATDHIYCQHLTAGDYYVKVGGDSAHCGTFALSVSRCRYRCCYGDLYDSCVDTTGTVCDVLGGSFDPGMLCGASPCPDIALCPAGAVYSQVPHGSDSQTGTSHVSDYYGPYMQYDDFSGLTQGITGIRFWGFHKQLHVDCVEQPDPFVVRFLEPSASPDNPPSVIVATFQDSLYGLPAGDYSGSTLYEYNMAFDPPIQLPDGWVTVYGRGNPDCDFFWQTSGVGNDQSWQLTNGTGFWAVQARDFAFCLTGAECLPPDSVTIRLVSSTTTRLDFYAPQDGVYHFWTTNQWNTEYPTGFWEMDNNPYLAGHRSYSFIDTVSHARYVITAECAP